MNLDKQIFIGSNARGDVLVWDSEIKWSPEQLIERQDYLAVHSVDTEEEGNKLVVLHCKLSRNDNKTYIAPGITGKFADLEKLAQRFQGS